MNYNLKTIICSFILILLIFTSYGQNSFTQPIPDKFIGKWTVGNQGGYFDITKDEITVEVMSNNIYISAKAKYDENEPDILELFLDKPTDLSSIGKLLSWDDFSKEDAICTIEFLNWQMIFVNWIGFTNAATKEIIGADYANWVQNEIHPVFQKQLKVNVQDTQGDFGSVTFYNSNQETLFYFNFKPQKGKIVIDGVSHTLTSCEYDNEEGTYNLKNDVIEIRTSKCIWDESEGGDCSTGKVSEVTVSMPIGVIILDNVGLQNCPLYE